MEDDWVLLVLVISLVFEVTDVSLVVVALARPARVVRVGAASTSFSAPASARAAFLLLVILPVVAGTTAGVEAVVEVVVVVAALVVLVLVPFFLPRPPLPRVSVDDSSSS